MSCWSRSCWLLEPAFLPQTLNTTVNIMISFIARCRSSRSARCAGSAFANHDVYRQPAFGHRAACDLGADRRPECDPQNAQLLLIILFFILGGAIGALATARIGEKALLLTCIPLSLVFTVMFVEEEHTLEAEESAGKER